MPSLTSALPQTITRWAKTGQDGFGGNTYAVPVTMRGRWEGVRELFRDTKGQEQVSNAIVYLEEAVEPEDYIAAGDLTTQPDPILAGAEEVMQYWETPDLRNAEIERRCAV